jgi:2-methylcitrate dehydratase PrpD
MNLPLGRMSPYDGKPNISAMIASHVARTQFADIPDKAVHVMKRSLVDAIGVTLGASGVDGACSAFVDLVKEEGGNPQSSVIGYGFKASASMAAFANGAMAHVLDFEDVHDEAVGHPNAAGIPAALAVAELRGGVSGKQLLTALILGGDLAVRMSFSVAGQRHSGGWFIGPVLGAYGATAAVSKILGLTEEQTVDAMSYTLCQATGSAELKFSPLSDVRAIRDAFGARAAVVSGRLAEKGVRGFDRPLDGEAGFYNLFIREGYNTDRLLDGLGQTYECANISMKPWPSCRGTHSFIEAALGIAAEHDVGPERIQSIRAVGSPDFATLAYPREQKLKPSTAIDAKFSLPFTVSTALTHGSVKVGHFMPDALVDPLVLNLASKLEYEVDEKLGPDQNSYGDLEITTVQGQVHRRRITQPFGHPTNPMTDAALREKFMDCASHARRPMSEENLQKLFDSILTLEKFSDIREVTSLM